MSSVGANKTIIGEASRSRLWFEWEWVALVVLVVSIYFPRMTALTIRGEESRRATVGLGMIETGDWIVPRQQGEAMFPSTRPPLQSWIMAGIGMLRGKIDTVAVRLPSVTAVLLVVLLIYGYGRTFLSRFGALAAGAAYATLGHVLELGQLGESDALFTLFVGGSLLVWHWGYVRGWPAICTWGAGYLLAALGTLTKGPQAPAYFAASVGVYLLLARRWRFALSWAHLGGILVYVVVLGSWQLPYYWQVGLPGVRHAYGGDASLYFLDWRWQSILKQLAIYPVKILLGCLMPWSATLLAYLNRDFRRAIGPAGDHVRFLAGSIAVTFPSVWLAPGAFTRFFMPLYPCLALLIGLAVQRCGEAAGTTGYRKLWPVYLSVVAAVMFGAGAVILGASLWVGEGSNIGQPLPFAVVYLVATVILGTVALWSRRAATGVQRVAGVLSVAAFLGFTSAGVITNAKMRLCEDAAGAVAELRQMLPEEANLVSIGPVHHVFVYHYGKLVEMRQPGEIQQGRSDFTYFCTMDEANVTFPWEKIAVISCDRNRSDYPRETVTVGRRL